MIPALKELGIEMKEQLIEFGGVPPQRVLMWKAKKK